MTHFTSSTAPLDQTLFHHAPWGMMELQRSPHDPTRFQISAINPMAHRMLRPRMDSGTTPDLAEALPGLCDPPLLENLNQTLLQAQPLQRVLATSLEDGSVLWLQCTLVPMAPHTLMMVLEDTTPLRRTEAALRESEERFAHLTESSSDAMVAIDHQGLVVLWNRAAKDLFGYEEHEVLGQPVIQLIPERYRHSHLEGFKRFRDTGIPHITSRTIELHALHRSHKEIPVEVAFTHWRGPDGMRSLAILRDISQRLKMESELRHMQKMEAIGTMAGGIAHDFNNILGVIIGYAEIVQDTLSNGDSPTPHHLQEILNAGLRARDLVAQLLTFSRQNASVPRPVMLAPIIKEGLRFLRTTLPATTPLHSEIQCQGGPVLADATQIYQLLLNLCHNAEHAMRGREGTLRIELREVESSTLPPASRPPFHADRYIQLSVIDNGAGIPTTIRNRIFDPFFTTKEVGEGTGLGLSVVHGIVSRHNGLIHVESREGEGSAFHVFLPKISATVQPTADSASGRAEVVFPLLSGKKLLLVEDDLPMLETTRRQLERVGCRVSAHLSSEEALKTFQSAPATFDAAITDYAMPRLTGLGLARRLRDARPDLPILLCTGYAAATMAEEMNTYGLFAILQKPVLFMDLRATLERALEKK